MTTRAVVTGIGVVAPSGIGAEAHWSTVVSRTRRTGPITLFDAASYPTRVAGQVPDFEALTWADNRRLVQTDRWTHLGFAATRLALACQLRSGLLSVADDPARAYQPFDADAAGYVPAEGGAVFVVEELSHALARGARIYGEVTGWGATHDAVHTGPGRGGDTVQYARAMRLALDRAGVTPDDVDVVLPDALGTPGHDRAEADALRAVFGARPVPVTTAKPLTGRAHQGGSALDVATALLAFAHDTLPASAGPDRPADGCELDFLREPRRPASRVALVAARGFDGFNSALVLRGAAARLAPAPRRAAEPGPTQGVAR
ncbi:beta-ketoacyl synthase N-terminal-like domain-containing protein [Micromonospora sp. DH15]|nr:beta-ketoacyl synthase N-terminal-like domain-containing protein [Micromonospora sp. DH15]